MPPVTLPGQDKQNQPRSTIIEDWGSLNTKAARPSVQPNEFPGILNFMPVGHGNLRTLYGEDVTKYSATLGKTIIYQFAYNLGATNYVAVFLSDGSAVQVRTSDGATTTIGAAATFYNGGNLPCCSQYEAQYLLIGSTIATSAYWIWDGTSLYAAGTIAPQVVISNGGTKYTSAPTVTAFGGSGTGATFTATVSNGSVTTITPLTPGSGWLLDEHVQLIVTGGGSDNQARAHATVSATGGVGAVNVTNGGSAYSNDVHLTFTGGGGTGAQAVVSTANNGVIVAVTVTNPGSGYTSAPTIAFVATAGTGATAVAQLVRGQITAITVDSGGSGYTGAPQVLIPAPDDNSFPTIQAAATALITAGAVSGFTITNPGAGYINCGIDLLGGNNAANASVTLMPFGLQATSIETYNSSVWTSVGTKMTFSGPASVSEFSTAAGGGSAPATDSFLRKQIIALKQANGFLYRLADSSINVISNVQTSSAGVTTFNNSNVDAQIGTAWRDSVVAFGRAIVFANPNGVYALYGGAAEKVSDALDGVFAKASFNTGLSGVVPSASVATIFGIRVYQLLITTTEPTTGVFGNYLCCWDGQKWFMADQNKTLTLVAGEEINSVLDTWGTDGTNLFRCFQTASTTLNKTFQTKLAPQPGYNIYKQVNRGYVVLENNSGDTQPVNVNMDTESASSLVASVQVLNTLTFVGSGGPIAWTGLGGAALTFAIGGLQVKGFSSSIYGRFLGWTLATTGSDYTVLSLTLLDRDYAPYG